MKTEDKDRAIRLFSYLREFVRLRSTIIRDISSYEEVLWFHEIPNEHGWYSAHWGIQDERTDDAWIEAKKPKIPECPLPPTICDGWYFRNDLINTGDIPAIQKVRHVTIQINDTDSKTENLRIEDYPAIENEWNKYIENKWFPWMEAYEKIRPPQEIYGKLFRMYQLSNKLGESYELILGIGFLTWKTKQNQDVQRHIISAQARLEFDSNTGTLTLRPGIEGAKMVFENDMLDPSELPPSEEFQAIESTLQENSENPWDCSIIHPIIRSWVHSLSPESAFSLDNIPPKVVTADPKCSFAPAIILRKRTHRAG